MSQLSEVKCGRCLKGIEIVLFLFRSDFRVLSCKTTNSEFVVQQSLNCHIFCITTPNQEIFGPSCSLRWHLFEGASLKVVEKFRGDDFHVWKAKMELQLATLDLWDIVDESEVAPSLEASLEVQKDFQRREKKALGTIAMNLDETNFTHIISCKRAADAWKTLCNIHESRNLSNILWSRQKFFTVKMEEGEDLIAHVNKVKALANQLAVVDQPLRDAD